VGQSLISLSLGNDPDDGVSSKRANTSAMATYHYQCPALPLTAYRINFKVTGY
jgi:hypothetical protein